MSSGSMVTVNRLGEVGPARRRQSLKSRADLEHHLVEVQAVGLLRR